VTSIAGADTGFILLGTMMMNVAIDQVFEVAVYEHDPNLAGAFARAGRGSLTDPEAWGARTARWEGLQVPKAGRMPAPPGPYAGPTGQRVARKQYRRGGQDAGTLRPRHGASLPAGSCRVRRPSRVAPRGSRICLCFPYGLQGAGGTM
jgi:hypothetical protein